MLCIVVGTLIRTIPFPFFLSFFFLFLFLFLFLSFVFPFLSILFLFLLLPFLLSIFPFLLHFLRHFPFLLLILLLLLFSFFGLSSRLRFTSRTSISLTKDIISTIFGACRIAPTLWAILARYRLARATVCRCTVMASF
ncbi:hypothetical protein BDP27DRAFT_1328499, partial [Rhodocollybia butyracea]